MTETNPQVRDVNETSNQHNHYHTFVNRLRAAREKAREFTPSGRAIKEYKTIKPKIVSALRSGQKFSESGIAKSDMKAYAKFLHYGNQTNVEIALFDLATPFTAALSSPDYHDLLTSQFGRDKDRNRIKTASKLLEGSAIQTIGKMFEDDIQGGRDEYGKLNLLLGAAVLAEDSVKKHAREILSNHRAIVLDKLNNDPRGKDSRLYFAYLETLVEDNEGDFVRDTLSDKLASLHSSTDLHEKATFSYYYDSDHDLGRILKDQVEISVKEAGLNFDKCLADWEISPTMEGEPVSSTLYENLLAISALREQAADAPENLQNRFNISNFTRHDTQVWKNMHETMDNSDIDWIFIVESKADYNGAHSSSMGGSSTSVDSAILPEYDNKKKPYVTRIIEVGGIQELEELSDQLADIYGQESAGLCILRAHGGKDGVVRLGASEFPLDDNPDFFLMPDKIVVDKTVKFLGVIKDGAPILAIICHGGAENLVAQQLHTKNLSTTYGPNKPAYADKITILRDDNNSTISALQVVFEGKNRELVETATYPTT